MANYVAEMEARWKGFQEESSRAKKAGKLVGRIISTQKADGYAAYQIIKIEDGVAYLKLIEVWDAYTDEIIEYMGRRLPEVVAKAIIKDNDDRDAALAKLIEENN